MYIHTYIHIDMQSYRQPLSYVDMHTHAYSNTKHTRFIAFNVDWPVSCNIVEYSNDIHIVSSCPLPSTRLNIVLHFMIYFYIKLVREALFVKYIFDE
jgi:uncharacterized protein YbgA (DUF1722 family)